jgi:hypothetical protein
MENHHLTKSSRTKYLNWLGREKLVCDRCGEELFPGDLIHRCGRVLCRKNSCDLDLSGNKNCRFYHSKCFEELFFDSEGGERVKNV